MSEPTRESPRPPDKYLARLLVKLLDCLEDQGHKQAEAVVLNSGLSSLAPLDPARSAPEGLKQPLFSLAAWRIDAEVERLWIFQVEIDQEGSLLYP